MAEKNNIREPKMAGKFYPSEKNELVQLVQNLLNKAKIEKNSLEEDNKVNSKLKSKIKALIVPHAGYIYSGIVAAFGYNLIPEKYNKIIILGPSHQVKLEGGAYDTNKFWKTPIGSTELFKLKNSSIKEHPYAHEFEHSIEVQLPFLQKKLSEFKICPIVIGNFPKKLSTEIINSSDEQTFIIVSSDLSHYLPYEVAIEKDKKTIEKIKRLEKIHPYDACGAECINVLQEIAEKNNWTPKLIEYKNSGDTAGSPFQVVGYASIAYIEK